MDLLNQKNYQKQKLKVAKLREKLFNQRHDFLNKVTTELIETYDVICVEDIHKEDFCRNHKLNKPVSDVSWALFVSKLEYKALWYDKQVIKLKKWGEGAESCIEDTLIGDIDRLRAEEDPETKVSIQLLCQGLKS